MSGEPKDKLAQIADVISEMIGRPYPPYSLLSTPFAFYGNSRMFSTKGDANKAYNRADALIKKARALETTLENLPDGQADFIFQSAYSSLQLESSAAEVVSHLTLQDWLCAIKSGAKIEADRIENEIKNFWNTGKRQPNIREQDVADAIAEIYVRETCRYPTSGHNDQKPSTKFAIAVDAVFKILGLTTSFRSPSDHAAEEIAGKIDLETAKRELAQRKAMQRALRFAIGRFETGLVPKSLISNATAKPRSD